MTTETIIRPDVFTRSRYFYDAWMDARRHWTSEDLTLLAAAADLRISYTAAANTLGRAPATLIAKAYRAGIHVPREWRALLRKYGSTPREQINYPYIVKPTNDHADLIAVNRLVSQAIPGREDVCQDIMLALWESRTNLAELRSDPRALKAFVRAFRKASFERSGFNVESMDVTIHGEDGDGKNKYEDARYQRTLADPDDRFIEKQMFGKKYATNFADRVVADTAEEEEDLGVPAAFWIRSGLA